jgi:hypothetical protein
MQVIRVAIGLVALFAVALAQGCHKHASLPPKAVFEPYDAGVIHDAGSDSACLEFQAPGSASTMSGGAAAPEESVLRPLTGAEYDHSVRDLLGDTSQPGRFFPKEDTTIGFASAPTMTSLAAEYLLVAAEKVAAGAVNRLPRLMSCDPATITDETCPTKFIASLAHRAFRESVSSDDLTPLFALYASERKTSDVSAALQTVIEAILISPRFLYLREDNPALVAQGEPLTAYELAARLSYALWNTTPDETLLSAADTGQLTPATIGDQARRLLKDPRAQDAVASFFSQWLELDVLDSLNREQFRAYPGLAASLRTETSTFTSYVFFQDDARLETLLTAPYTFVDWNAGIAYGLANLPRGEFVQVTLPANQRAGVLTQPSMLTIGSAPARTSPTKRGKFVRERLLCQPLPPPPNDVNANLDVGLTTDTVRDIVTQHMSNPACASCHQLMDPIGLGFEGFDATGRVASLNGQPLDSSGAVTATQDADGTFNGPVELAHRLAKSAQVRQCMTREWFRFMLRRLELSDDQPSIDAADKAFAAADGDMREMIIALTRTDAFTHHHALTGASP